MPTKKYYVKLSEKERQELPMLTHKGVHPTRKVTRARILLLADEERIYSTSATYLHCSYGTVIRMCQRYCQEGLPFALHEKPRSGAPGKIHGRFEATLTALACSTPPEGFARWTVRLLADKLVELGLIEAISSTRVWELLESNDLKPWQKKQWCIGDLTTEFLWRMENILDLYELPYNPKRPLICFDERPCQLLNHVVMPLPMEPGTPQREDYQYERNGVCSLLIAFEPLKGYRFVQVRAQRTKQDYARFMNELADTQYPQADHLILVQDNLHTHTPGSFYAVFPAPEAFAFAKRFVMHATPNHASWLNMVEIELSVIAKRCLDRRIGDQDTLEREVLACVKERNEQHATVQWRFTKNDARTKLKRFYPIDQN
jgi:transposase